MSTLQTLFLFWQVENLEDREARIKKTMQKIIDDFVKDSSAIDFHCSADLSTYERMLLHDLAEKLQLGHVSQGDGKKRHIVLSKGGGLKKVEVNEDDGVEKRRGAASGEEATSTSTTSAMVLCSSCAKQVPKINIELHKMKCTVLDVTRIDKTSKKKVLLY